MLIFYLLETKSKGSAALSEIGPVMFSLGGKLLAGKGQVRFVHLCVFCA